MLVKTRTVLRHQGEHPGGPWFWATLDEGEDATRATRIVLDPEVWVEMGSPETVTVTVEPGDQLNGDLQTDSYPAGE